MKEQSVIRQAIARDQLEAAREELHRQQENIERGGLRDVGALWLAEDKHWFWTLQVEAGRLAEAAK